MNTYGGIVASLPVMFGGFSAIIALINFLNKSGKMARREKVLNERGRKLTVLASQSTIAQNALRSEERENAQAQISRLATLVLAEAEEKLRIIDSGIPSTLPPFTSPLRRLLLWYPPPQGRKSFGYRMRWPYRLMMIMFIAILAFWAVDVILGYPHPPASQALRTLALLLVEIVFLNFVLTHDGKPQRPKYILDF